MRIKLIVAATLSRETGYLSAACPNTLDISWLQQEEHITPLQMQQALQQAINAAENSSVRYDAIAVGAGFWDVLGWEGQSDTQAIDSASVLSPIHSERYPLILPRAHDWITLLLGSKERYREMVNHHDTIWWLTPGRMERGFLPSRQSFSHEGCRPGSPTAVYIKTEALFQPDWREMAQSVARQLHWDYEELPGSLSLLQNLLWGSWDEEDFLTLSPGQKVRFSFDRHILESVC